ncbi:MAG: TIM barrel protein, partial [Roseburia sp.]|nr:TIM barrel protein [Roseburia sp.]
MLVGNHLSASKGYEAMGKMALKLNANTFAFFTRNPRGGKAKEINQADVDRYLALAKEHQFGKLVAHAPYTMNLCAAKEDIRAFSKEMIADDLKRMEYTPGNYYNFHPGSHVGQGAEAGIELIADALNDVLTKDQNTIV